MPPAALAGHESVAIGLRPFLLRVVLLAPWILAPCVLQPRAVGLASGPEHAVQIDWSFLGAVNWAELAWFSGIVFLATLVSNILMFKHWLGATVLAVVLFAAGYVFLVYYPHERRVPGLSTAPPNFGPAITAQKNSDARPEGLDSDRWRQSLLEPTTICSTIRCLGFSVTRAAANDR